MGQNNGAQLRMPNEQYLTTDYSRYLEMDKLFGIPWTILWLTIISVHWNYLTTAVIARSALHYSIIIAPAVAATLLDKQTYRRFRNILIVAAIWSYVTHPGGGLARDALQQAVQQKNFTIATLFARLLVGSRTLFWLILISGYRLHPIYGIPLNAAGIAYMTVTKPSSAFCAALTEIPSTGPLFHSIANALPLATIIQFPRPELYPETDICNPLVLWIQLSFGLLIPAALHICGEIKAQEERSRQTAWTQGNFEQVNKASASPCHIAILIILHVSTLLWHILIKTMN